MTGSVDALLFDLGDVLVRLDWDRAFAHWSRAADLDPAVIRSRWRVDDQYERHERGELDAEQYFGHLAGLLDAAITLPEIHTGWNKIFTGLVPGVEALLTRAEGRLPLYLFSNTNKTHQQCWMELYRDALSRFDGVFVSNELGYRKPEPDAFLAVADAMSMDPGRILFFDDLAANVAGARAVGMQATQVRSVADIERALDDVLGDGHETL